MEGIAAFVTELASYYMDFLETDFHKRRLPKRSVKFRNSKNLRIGLNLAKYTTFQSAALKVIKDSMSHPLNISRGTYKANLAPNIQRLVETRTTSISDEELADIADYIATTIIEIANPQTKDIDNALSESADDAAQIIRSKVVTPFATSIEHLLQNRAGADIESIYSLEENLLDILTDPLDEIISEWVANVYSGQSDDISQQIREALNGAFVRDSIREYFADFSVNDLFFEIKELVDNNLILDKQDIYFYFCDIHFLKDKYPLFYVPLTITKPNGIDFRVVFEPVVYINKKAIEFIVQEYNKEREQTGRIQSISKRIIYPSEHTEPMPEVLSNILSDVINFFHLQPTIDLVHPERQEARGLSATVSNSMHICIFDKSDEALVNDYEKILDLMKSQDTELISSFTGLIHDFIGSEPKSFRTDVGDEWAEMSSEQKLVFSSPIPLNPEQRQILQALDKEGCKYIAVQGPPGTGKSHTITAIVFQAILHNQSVLMLSDKKEALDVIEEKITDVMNRVRISDDFQNPILRLGKTGNTYSQILSTASMNKTRQCFMAVRKNRDFLKTNIHTYSNNLTFNIKASIANYGTVMIVDIQHLARLDSQYEYGEKYPINFNEVLKSEGDIDFVNEVQKSMIVLDDTLHYSTNNLNLLDMFQTLCRDNQGIDVFSSFLAFVKMIQALRSTYQDRSFLRNFNSITKDQVKALRSVIMKYRELGSGIFGYFLKGKEVAKLSHELNAALFFEAPVFLRTDVEDMERALAFFGDANSMLKQHGLLSFLADPLPTIHESMLLDNHLLDEIDLTKLVECIKKIGMYVQEYPLSAEKINLTPSSLCSCFENNLRRLAEHELDDMGSHLRIHLKLANAFQSIPRFDYTRELTSYQELLTHQMTHKLDERLLNFYDNATSTAKTLRGIIKQKQRFPKNEFEKLKEAFPCIVAGIRDYAEYIPLEPEMFDIVIIDEASQVSIAQAFPALLRAKKVVVLGDKEQFSNVKTAQARSDTNNQYLNRLDISFRNNVSTELAQLERLKKFNIKTSILEFFEFISNFDIMLLKHFRGYRELISYSSKEFYKGNLQAIRIRGKAIEEIIQFSFIDHDGRQELNKNTNMLECQFILDQLSQMKEAGSHCSVGIITPHTNQQKLIASAVSNDLNRDYYYENMNLKIMTFDTCQGEERDILFYSMVASLVEDKLWGIFIKDLASKNQEEGGKIKAQRLNVGFSRAKECMHFVLSKPIEEFKGAIGQALRHFASILKNAQRLPDSQDVDSRSPMEAKVLEWIKNTAFFQNDSDHIELKAQFPLGDYLKQLDPTYDHPAYRVDFLLLYRSSDDRQHNIIIEYDGFNEHFGHFTQNAGVDEFNYDSYYTAAHVEREKVLEGYGYKFLRINRFNLGKEPVLTLNERLCELTQPQQSAPVTMAVHQLITDQNNGDAKKCIECGELKSIANFSDPRLPTGVGRKCNECKARNRPPTVARITPPQTTTAHNQCPKCGSPMVHKTGRYGAFFGCSTYPKCHGTRKIR